MRYSAIACPISQISKQAKGDIGGNKIRELTGTFRKNLQAIVKALAVILSEIKEPLGTILVPTSQACLRIKRNNASMISTVPGT